MKKMIKIALAVCIILYAFSAPVSAEIPRVMQYQGKLTDSNNNPLQGNYNLTFRIYTFESGGNPTDAIWNETHQNVEIINGIFSVLLGSVDQVNNPLTLPFDRKYWLGIEINSDGEMTPRQQLASVGFAYRAASADSLSSGITIPFYLSGLELKWINNNTIQVIPGALDIASVMYNNQSHFALENIPANGSIWLNGSPQSSGWAYVYLGVPSDSLECKLHTGPPEYATADTSSGSYTPKRYIQYEENFYRCIGAVRLEGGAVNRFYQDGNRIMWDVPVNITTALSNGNWSSPLSCSVGIPAISTRGVFGLYVYTGTAGSCTWLTIRPNGSNWPAASAQTNIAKASSLVLQSGDAHGISAQRICSTDYEQKIQYYTQIAVHTAINVEGYILNIR